jgi:hypothetical protein
MIAIKSNEVNFENIHLHKYERKDKYEKINNINLCSFVFWNGIG